MAYSILVVTLLLLLCTKIHAYITKGASSLLSANHIKRGSEY